jgi:hypothetical protein
MIAVGRVAAISQIPFHDLRCVYMGINKTEVTVAALY